MAERPVIFRRRPGQPRKLWADEKTLRQLKAMASTMATTREIASMLLVSHQTFLAFCKANPIVKEILEDGRNVGKASVRQAQFKAAVAGNVTAQIWLGKNYLGQSDRLELTGKDGGAIEVRTLTDFYGGRVIEHQPDPKLVVIPPLGDDERGGGDEPGGDAGDWT